MKWQILSQNAGSMTFLNLRPIALDLGQVLLDRFLDLLEGPHLDLTDAFPGHAELSGELFERDRIVRQAARFEDAALARVEHGERRAPGGPTGLALLPLDEHLLLALAGVAQPVLPFAATFAFVAQGRIEGGV